jgi:phage replication initiation protein
MPTDARNAPPARPDGGGLAAHGEPAAAEAAESPRLVTRGESLGTPHPLIAGESCELVAGPHGKLQLIRTPVPRCDTPSLAALTDYLNVTFRFDGSPQALARLVRRLSEELTPKLGGLTDLNRGLYGYRHSLAFDNGKALFAHGGQRETGFLSLPGTACALVPDWHRAYRFLRDELQAKITRWDGAVDDFKGEHSVDLAMEWYLGGSFGTGGNKPSMRQAGNWAEPDGSGRTLYIGKGAHGKMLRVYEKGKQLGDPNDPWVRWELQLGNRDRVIPLEVMLSPGPYVAGAYDCLGWINEEASRVRVVRKTAQIGYAALTEHARNAYGRFLYVMRDVEGSADAVLDKLAIPGFPKGLQMPDIDMPEGEP